MVQGSLTAAMQHGDESGNAAMKIRTGAEIAGRNARAPATAKSGTKTKRHAEE